jgi:glyoxylase-like metal-dependent hydrolase (beta-lactamase superfamily II)
MMQQLTKNVFVETGVRGCNHGFVKTAEGIVMIDTPQKPTDAIKWRNLIASHGEVRYLFNTEPHADHWTGNAFYPHATIIAHEGVRDRILAEGSAPVIQRVKTMGPEQQVYMDDYIPKAPDVTFTTELKLHVGDHDFIAIHHPGHTPYQAAILIPQEGIVFTSDNIFYKCQTFLHEALPQAWLDTLEKLRVIDADVFVPGHGEICGKDYLDEQGAFIQEWLDLVQGAIDRGMTKAAAVEQLSLLERYPMDIDIDFMGPMVMQWNVNRLWDVLTEH